MTVPFIAFKTVLLKKSGIKVIHFGERNKSDYILVPFMLFFFYLVVAESFGLPSAGNRVFYRYYVHWYGSAACFIGLTLIVSAIITLKQNFRIGLDENTPVKLITKGPFAINRNPIYSGFLFIFAGVFITYSNWIFLVYFIAGTFFINRQIIKEEESMKKLFNKEYIEYCRKVRRYF